MAIDKGEAVTLTANFYDSNDNLDDPGLPVRFVVEDRAGNSETITATQQSTGIYSADYTTLASGVHYYTVYTSDTPPKIEQGTFTAKQVVANIS